MNHLHVLLVEDNLGDIRLTREAFEEAHIQAKLSVVMDGEEAMKFLRRQNQYSEETLPNLILLDLNLPKWDGKDVLRQIKTDKLLRRIPVVVLTTSNAEQDILESYELYANCYLNKPLDFDKFLDVIEKIHQFWLQTAVLPPSGV